MKYMIIAYFYIARNGPTIVDSNPIGTNVIWGWLQGHFHVILHDALFSPHVTVIFVHC